VTFLPIVERELRLAARRRGTYWLRVVAALVGLVIGSGMLLLSLVPFGGQPQMGGAMFGTLTWLSLAAALSAGLFFTSDCLSEEKREGTLGFLFLTDLRGYDVVLGKLMVTSLRCVFALLAIFPVLATTLLMGGVEVGQFWRTIFALGHALFFSLSVGLFVSAISRQSQKALAGTVLVLILFVGVGPSLDGLLALAGGSSRPLLSLASPGYVFLKANYSSSYWPAFLVSQGVAWLLLALACVLLPRTWQERPERTSAKVLNRSYTWRYGGAARRAGLREKLLGINPVMWLAARERGQAFWLWVVALTMLGFFLALVFTKASGGWWQGWSMVSNGLWYILYLWAAAKACQFFAEARRNGMIELLLAVPLASPEIVQGPWRALVRMFAKPVLLLLGMQFAASLLTPGAGGGIFGQVGEPVWWLAVCGAAIGVGRTLATLVALGWFGLWMGLVSKNTLMATLKTIVFVQVLPWFAIILITGMALPLVLFSGVGASGGAPSQTFANSWLLLLFTALPAGLALTKGVFFWTMAQRKLLHNFRDLAVRAVVPIQSVVAPPVFPQKP
jgi:ABC-type transport system involved in multi-copper enzyme maturation permease subunit